MIDSSDSLVVVASIPGRVNSRQHVLVKPASIGVVRILGMKETASERSVQLDVLGIKYTYIYRITTKFSCSRSILIETWHTHTLDTWGFSTLWIAI